MATWSTWAVSTLLLCIDSTKGAKNPQNKKKIYHRRGSDSIFSAAAAAAALHIITCRVLCSSSCNSFMCWSMQMPHLRTNK